MSKKEYPLPFASKGKEYKKNLREIETRKLWNYSSSYILKGCSVMPDESTTMQDPSPLG